MATVPFVQRRDLVPAALAFNLARNLKPMVNMARTAYSMWKGRPTVRRKLFSFRRRRSIFRRKRTFTPKRGIRTYRAKGRKTYGNRTMTLRLNTHQRHNFTQTTAGDFYAHVGNLDHIGGWLPLDWQIDDLQLAKFNNAATRRLVSIHVYMKNVRYT